MAYIGNSSPSRFVSNRAASVYSGDGITTDFTLEQAVVQDEDILVSVDGVIQEPSVAYAVSNGTTLAFTGAPSSNAGNNIFVYYLASQVGTVGHPSNQALSATNGTFSGNTTVAGTGTFTGDVTVGDGSAADKKILFDGNAQDYHIGLDDSADSLIIGKGSALGTTTSMAIDANGIITKPLQPAFCVASSGQNNLATNTSTDIQFATIVYDIGSNFASNIFNAPVTGKYQLSFVTYFNNVDTAATVIQFNLSTSNRAYYHIIDPNFSADINYYPVTISVTADMDAGDEAKIVYTQSNGSAQSDVNSDTLFTGYLLG